MQTTKTKIHEILGYTADEFSTIQTERYMRWCMNRSMDNGTDLQKILANTSINRYYNAQMALLENKFLDLIDGKMSSLSTKTIHDFYSIIVVDMFKIFPKPLIDNARNLNLYAN